MAAVKQVNPNFFLDLIVPDGLVYANGSPMTSFPEANGPQLYLSLYTTAPTPTTNGVEVSGTGYARIPVWMSKWVYRPISGVAPYGVGYIDAIKCIVPSGRNIEPSDISAQESYNTAVTDWYMAGHTFTAGGSWGTVVAWGLCSASSGGSICVWDTFSSPMTIGSGDTITFAPYEGEPQGTPGLEITHYGPQVGAEYDDRSLSVSPSSLNSRIQSSKAASALDQMFPTSTCVMKLYSSMPTDVVSGFGLVAEISGGGYSEQPVVWSGNASSTWPASKTMAENVTFTCDSGSWSVAGFAIVDPTIPTALRYAQRLDTNITVNAGQKLVVEPVTIRLY